jgi:hypothetical protein
MKGKGNEKRRNELYFGNSPVLVGSEGSSNGCAVRGFNPAAGDRRPGVEAFHEIRRTVQPACCGLVRERDPTVDC